MFASPVSASAPGFDLSAGPLLPGVSNSESFVLPVSVCVRNPEFTVCPVNPVTTTETIYELPAFLVSVKLDSEPTVSSDSVSKSDVKPIVSPISANGSEYEHSVYLAFITELSVSPESVNASICELSVGLYSAVKSDAEVSAYPVSTSELVGELFTCPVSISELTYELSVPSVVIRVNIDALVFPAPVLETVYALSVLCVSVSPRLQSLLWVPDQTVPSWCSPVPPWCSSDPSWCSPDPSWCSPALSAPPWRSPTLSAPHWWAPALSALPCRSPTLSAPHWWAPALSAPPWRSPNLSAPHWWAPALSAPPWRSAVSLWWSSVPLWRSSAQPWWSSAPPALPWRSSASHWWALVPSALPQSPVSPFPHGPGPPSLPLFRLHSTALLDCIGASGSRSLWGGSVTNPVCGLPPDTFAQYFPVSVFNPSKCLHVLSFGLQKE